MAADRYDRPDGMLETLVAALDAQDAGTATPAQDAAVWLNGALNAALVELRDLREEI